MEQFFLMHYSLLIHKHPYRNPSPKFYNFARIGYERVYSKNNAPSTVKRESSNL